MADVDFDDAAAGALSLRAAKVQRFINMAGAAISVALLVGLGFWGYKVAVRDVTGVPVLRALAGPMRVAPVDPGGEVAAHLGLSVNAVAAEGVVAAMPDEVVLAPAPVELSLDDQPPVPAAPPAPTAAGAVVAAGPVALAAPSAAAAITPEAQAATALALAEALAEGVAPLTETAAAPADLAPVTATVTPLAPGAGTEDPATIAVAAAEPAPPGALTRSLRPKPRPEGDGLDSGQTEAVIPASTTREVDPASLSAGTRLVQLGAFDDEAGARAEWDRLLAKFGDLVAGKARVIQAAQSGGRNFVRLRAEGFTDEADARRFCSALLAENAACIPVAHR